MMTKVLVVAAVLLGSALAANAFEIKGYKPGMDVTRLDLKSCEQIANADSGVPGYLCNTTLGGEQAQARLLVFSQKLVGAVFRVQTGQFRPMLEALSDKYGRPGQSNRYIEDYDWNVTPRYSPSSIGGEVTAS